MDILKMSKGNHLPGAIGRPLPGEGMWHAMA